MRTHTRGVDGVVGSGFHSVGSSGVGSSGVGSSGVGSSGVGSSGGLARLVVGLAFILGALGCSSGKSDAPVDDRLVVVTTTGMIADAASNVGGEHVVVTALMGPGVDPHLYKASEGDVARLTDADLILYNGLHLEAKLGEVLGEMNRRSPTVAVAEVIDEAKLDRPAAYEGAFDPHVWFDVQLWITVVGRVTDALVEVDPEHEADYRSRAEAYVIELQALDLYVADQARSVPPDHRVLVTAHDAFHYFGRAYGFEVKGLQGISTQSEAGTADVAELARFIAARRIPAIFVESSVPPRAIEAVQAAVRARGFEVAVGGELFSDAMGDPGTPEGTYIGMVRHNVDTIVAALLRNTRA
jgi:manganese/zinc/iron transport system substrate-binding protein